MDARFESGWETAGNPDFGINSRSPDSDNRDVSTAWQQLHCSAELANYAVEDVHKIATGETDARELDEVKYLAGEAMEELHGNPIGVQCGSAPLCTSPLSPILSCWRRLTARF